jgi:hypothetical protein
MAFRINEDLVVKAGYEDYSVTEHRNLTYLQEQSPDFTVPKPHGLISLGIHCFLFTTYIPGMTLERAWPELKFSHKQSVSHQLDALLTKPRSMSFPKHTPLGDVTGGGCRDLRQSQRVRAKPVMSVEEFEDFILTIGKLSRRQTY